MTAQPLPGDILLFGSDGSFADHLIEIGEMLEHPRIAGPYFVHVGLMLGVSHFAEQTQTAHEAELSDIPASRALYLKRLPLTSGQRDMVPFACAKLYGYRYDLMLDAFLGLRYLWHGIADGVRALTYDYVRLPDIHVGFEADHRLNCTSFDCTALRGAGYKGFRRRFYSPEGLAVDLPGPLWRIR